jgi:iron complex outermembrane receptor protein
MSRLSLLSNTFLVTVTLAGSCLSAAAEVPAPATDTSAEQVIVTGTRDPKATARNSISPIIVITGAQLRATGQADIRDALTQIAPSITRPDLAGGNANLVDAISLRGLTSDQTLVLVDGKRRHGTAIIADYEGPQTGTTPVDIDMIPTAPSITWKFCRTALQPSMARMPSPAW